MPTIAQVLHRRTDLSTFVVHLTRRSATDDAYQNLVSMLVNGVVEARKPMGWARDAAVELGAAAVASQRVACFSEAPLEQIYSLVAPIDGRQVNLEPYGLAFTKMTARRSGINPVWYVDMTPGHDWTYRNALDDLRDQAMALGDTGFGTHPAAKLFPLFEWMGTWSDTSQKEFWWEREWRHVGDYRFGRRDVALIIAPYEHHDDLRAEFRRPCIDAEWSLERMVGSLAGLPPEDMTPFGVR